jgi:hypothetical protein
MIIRNILAAMLMLCAPQLLGAAEFRPIEEQSVVAVVIHKAGVGSVLARDHLITASHYTLSAAFDKTAPLDTTMRLEVFADGLMVDDPGMQGIWSERIESLQLTEQPFEEIADKSRIKIRSAMLGKKQLEADTYPVIEARIVRIGKFSTTMGPQRFQLTLLLELQVHGKTVTKPVAAHFDYDGEILKVEAAGSFRFTDFGMKPYSAIVRAVKIRDEFTIYANMALVAAEN